MGVRVKQGNSSTESSNKDLTHVPVRDVKAASQLRPLFCTIAAHEKIKPTKDIYNVHPIPGEFISPDSRYKIRLRLLDSDIRYLPIESFAIGIFWLLNNNPSWQQRNTSSYNYGRLWASQRYILTWRPMVFTMNKMKSTQWDCKRKAPFGVWVFLYCLRQSILFSAINMCEE